MNILVSGSSGLIGSALLPRLHEHKVVKLTRVGASKPVEQGNVDRVEWDPKTGKLLDGTFEGFDAVIHLAGENIASQRWSQEKKGRIRDSRIDATKKLCQNLITLSKPPKTFICASAIGYYGDRGDEVLDEKSTSGAGFLAEVCRQVESSTQIATEAGIRVVLLRIGVVLSKRGGALAKMLLPFQMGLGGPLGSGRQYMSWIAIDDMVGCIVHVLTNETLSGPVNAVAPNPVTNAEYSRILGNVLKRPAFMPMPEFGVRMLFGELADEILLASMRVKPTILEISRYKFQYPHVSEALEYLLG